MAKKNFAPLEILSYEDLTRIHEASVKILEETGMEFPNEDALEVFKKHGAKIENKKVFLTKKLIEDALDKCPHTFKWRGRKEENSVIVGDGSLVQSVGCPVYVQEGNRRRLGTMEDFRNLQKLNQSSDLINISGFIPVEPSDIDPKTKHLYMQYEVLKNTDKPIHGHVCGEKNANQMLDMLEIAFGEKDLLENDYISGLSINPLSPLSFSHDEIGTLLAYAKRNQPIFPGPLSIGGLTGPLDHIGLTILANAEVLATIVLTQLINPGNPIIIAIASVFANMRSGTYCSGSPDNCLTQIVNLQVARDLYKIPTRINAGPCDAKTIDVQAGIETTQNLIMAMLSGCNLVNEAFGILDGIMTVSYEKMMIDEEIIKRVMHLIKPIDSSDAAFSIEAIQEVGSRNSYLEQMSTFERCRGIFYPSLSNWDSYNNWQDQGASDIIERAEKKYKNRLSSSPETLLDSEVEKDLKLYIEKEINKI